MITTLTKLFNTFFFQVYSAVWENGPAEERSTVLKVQMPANDWEWYILSQLQTRFSALEHPLKENGTDWSGGFMSAPRCFTYRDGAVITSKLQKMGTLLDLVNLTKNADKSIIEPIAIYLTAELLGLMELLHSLNIVHADLKPDNFLMRHTPSTNTSPSLQLIDFGKAIDIKLEAAEESKPVQTQPQEGQPNPSTTGETATVPQAQPETAAQPPKQPENGGDKSMEVDGKDEAGEKKKKAEDGRTGKYHLDYFGIAGTKYQRTKTKEYFKNVKLKKY